MHERSVYCGMRFAISHRRKKTVETLTQEGGLRKVGNILFSLVVTVMAIVMVIAMGAG